MIKSWYYHWRTLIHVPHGAIPPYLALEEGAGELAIAWTMIFLAYEFMQGWRTKDMSYKDIFSFAAGFLISMVVFLCVSI